jgi:hypothetical protein
MYRIVRPYNFNPARAEMEYAPRGGIVFKLQTTEEHKFWVVAAVCPMDTKFSMDVATRLCDKRADQIRENDPNSTNGCFTHQPWPVMRQILLDWCANYRPKDDSPIETYRAHEWNRIATMAHEILAHNRREEAMLEAHKNHLQNEQIKGMYASIDRLKG